MKLRHVIVFFLLALASRESIASSDSLFVTVDTLCDSWKFCVTDSTYGGGIASIKIVDQDISNVEFRSTDNSGNDSLLFAPDTPKTYCFKLYKRRSYLISDVYIMIVNKRSQTKLIHFNGADNYSLINVYDGMLSFGPINFKKHLINDIVLTSAVSNNRPIKIREISVINNSKCFSIPKISSLLPFTLDSNKELTVSIRYDAIRAGWKMDSLKIVTDCSTDYVQLSGATFSGVLSASDIDFGEVSIGGTSCKTGYLSNEGLAYFTMYGLSVAGDSNNGIKFIGNHKFTVTMQIGQVIGYEFCYSPIKLSATDSVIVKWDTDIDFSLLPFMKDSSIIRGRAKLPSLSWNKPEGRMLADSTCPQILNLILTNYEKFSIAVKRFYISGEDSAEFSIINSLIPLQNVTITSDESDWFTIGFVPDMKKPISKRYENRHATLNIETEYYTITLPLVAGFGLNGVKHQLALEDLSFSPNPVYGQDATLYFRLAEPKQLSISIYDMLGREVISLPSQYYSSGSYSNAIGTSKLGDGSYILRVSDGSFTKSIGFRVVR